MLKFKGNCVLCRRDSYRSLDLCRQCEGDLPFLHPQQVVCLRCGLALNQAPKQNVASGSLICGRCQVQSPAFYQTIALMDFNFPVDVLLKRSKLDEQLQCLRVLCTIFTNYLSLHYQSNCKPQALLAVPLHPAKLRSRGFNQADIIANCLAKGLALPTLANACARPQQALRQSALSVTQRRQNLRGAFTVTATGLVSLPHFNHIALVDDVVTTGATCQELAKTLQSVGVERVDVLCLARTPLRF